jgi:SAM-dependent methyltransferase
MSRFGPDPLAFFNAVYRDPAPWDVGEAQPALLELIEEFPPAGSVLDVGCGSGDLAIALAQRGFEVLGVDFVETAVEQARAKANGLPGDARRRLRFQVGDALHPSTLGYRAGAVVDSGFLHLFDPDARDRFAAQLAAALPPGGRYYVLGFAVTFPIEHAPLQVDCDELAGRFCTARGWRMLACRSGEFLSRVGTAPATAACVERLRPRSLGA